MPRRAAVPTTDSMAAQRSGPQAERNPPVTLRYTTIGRRSRSLPLLSGGASGCSRKVNRLSRTARWRLRKRSHELGGELAAARRLELAPEQGPDLALPGVAQLGQGRDVVA